MKKQLMNLTLLPKTVDVLVFVHLCWERRKAIVSLRNWRVGYRQGPSHKIVQLKAVLTERQLN